MMKKKKIILMTSLICLLALTAVFNVLLAKDFGFKKTEAVATSNFFTTCRTERTDSRNETLLQLDNVLETFSEDTDRYADAADMKLKLVATMENELAIETMIKSLGFSDAVVTIGVDSENVNVFINSNELDYDTALSIYNLLKNEMGIAPTNIFIMPVYAQI